jgi:UDP-N-acetylglucosamine 4-epimerase
MHSQADIGKAKSLLGYAPSHDLIAGLRAAMPWYVQKFAAGAAEHGAAATEIAREAD